MSKERFCWYCGESMGVIADKYYHRSDTCGKIECNREARDVERQERDDAHDRLDEEMGW